MNGTMVLGIVLLVIGFGSIFTFAILGSLQPNINLPRYDRYSNVIQGQVCSGKDTTYSTYAILGLVISFIGLGFFLMGRNAEETFNERRTF